MKKNEQTTILERIAGDSTLLAYVLEGAKKPSERYLANLILNSSELVRRRELAWEYKSLLHYGEEDFAKGGSFRLMYNIDGDQKNLWHRQAAKALADEVGRSVIYEDEEGLVLYVRDEEEYRPAKHGDAPYDFVKRLFADGNLFDIEISSPPSWAEELFVNKHNLDAYACLWYDLDYLSKPGREELKRVRREAVWRETLRLAGREPYVSSAVPEPSAWPVDGAVAAGPISDAGPLETPLGNRERNTLLCILAAVCHEGGIDYTKAAKSAVAIQKAASEVGIVLAESTIESHLKRISGALDSRSRIAK